MIVKIELNFRKLAHREVDIAEVFAIVQQTEARLQQAGLIKMYETEIEVKQ